MAGGKGKLTYAGQPLPSWTSPMAGWVEKYIDPHDLWEFAFRTIPGARLQYMTFLPWLHQKPIRVGRLFWPFGATRWAVGHFIISDSALALVRPLCYPAGASVAQPLLLDDGTTTITAQMYMLPPRRLTFSRRSDWVTGDTLEDLYLLTLVDQRFWWWGANAGNITIEPDVTTWVGLYDLISTALGTVIDAEVVDSDYFFPAFAPGFSTSYESIPVLLDAVSLNCGQRIVAGFDGSIYAFNLNTSIAIRDANAVLKPNAVAGGPFNMDAVI